MRIIAFIREAHSIRDIMKAQGIADFRAPSSYIVIRVSASSHPRLTAEKTASIKALSLSVLMPAPLTFRPLIVTSTQVIALCESPVPRY